jgi:hypothetical protein
MILNQTTRTAFGIIVGCALLAAGCGERRPQEAAEPASSRLDAAAQPVEGDAASAWIEMTGVWAPEGACGDYTQEWRLEPEAFHLHEMHCKIERLEMLANGVRAIAQCAVEGDDDGVEDVYNFVRRPDYSLSIINEASEAATDGLRMCGEEAP